MLPRTMDKSYLGRVESSPTLLYDQYLQRVVPQRFGEKGHVRKWSRQSSSGSNLSTGRGILLLEGDHVVDGVDRSGRFIGTFSRRCFEVATQACCGRSVGALRSTNMKFLG